MTGHPCALAGAIARSCPALRLGVPGAMRLCISSRPSTARWSPWSRAPSAPWSCQRAPRASRAEAGGHSEDGPVCHGSPHPSLALCLPCRPFLACPHTYPFMTTRATGAWRSGKGTHALVLPQHDCDSDRRPTCIGLVASMAGVSVWGIPGHRHGTNLPENPAKSAWDSAAAAPFSCDHFLLLSLAQRTRLPRERFLDG